MLRGRADNPQKVVHRLRNEHAARSDLAQNWSMNESPRTSPPRRGAPERADASPASDPRRTLPKVDALLAHPAVAARAAAWGRGPVLGAVRRVLDSARRAATAGEPVPGLDQLAAMVTGDLDGLAGQRMRAVINATGVVLHTNLGRAPLSQAAVAAITQAAGYCTVEYDLAAGARGRRGAAAEALLREVTGAPAALVVNNAAGALLLALGGLARDCEVVVSRGQLIEIGGEFRLPAIMQAAGVDLVEVGTTNRTHLADYERAIGARTACLLAVHPSNYQVVGFTTDPPLDAVADLAHQHGLPLLHDLGSGLVGDPFGDEPSVGQSLAAGADLVLFSGDKLLGGPQAGLLVGRQDLIQTLARNPLARAVRADKLTIAALEVTLATHAAGRRGELPVWRALGLRDDDLRPRAEALARELGTAATVRGGVSVAGGGSLPGEGLPSPLVEVDPGQTGDETILARLRAADPPVIARAERGRVIIDLRTVPPEQDQVVSRALREALGAPGGAG
jgi:L-seryl-tRNA(Ser) seleniumtransferase